MKITSSKTGSSRERVDVEADMLTVAAWRPVWEPSEGGMLKAKGRALVLSSRFGSERNTELHLTETEAIAIARAVAEDLFSTAANAAAARPAAEQQTVK